MHSIIDILLPPTCSLCHKNMHHSSGGIHICMQCQSTVLLSAAQSKIDPSKFPTPSNHYYIGIYSGLLREIIKKIKYQHTPSLLSFLGSNLGRKIAVEPCPWNLIVPIPIRFTSYYRRGFHQTLLLAEAIRMELPRKIQICHALGQKHWIKHQTFLSRNQRIKNMKDAFYVRAGINGKNILLVDDVVTTGSTMHAAAETLLRGGAIKVDFAYIARAPYCIVHS